MPRKILIVMLAVALVSCVSFGRLETAAVGCDQIEVVFVRGSGEELNGSSYQSFYTEMTQEMSVRNYSIYELNYPAVAVGLSGGNLGTLLGAKISAGESYKFGKSVAAGVTALKSHIKEVSTRCPETKFALVGYSQGAMVITRALRELDPEKVFYVATLGDPKLYLPEGLGARACRDTSSYSPYRANVPDCRTYEGILTGYKPYIPEGWLGKVGAWCNYKDIMCSSRLSWGDIMGPHLKYGEAGRYKEVAAQIATRAKVAIARGAAAWAAETAMDVIIDDGGVAASAEEGAINYVRSGEGLKIRLGAVYRNLIIVNDVIYGFSELAELEIGDLDFSQDNNILAVAFSEDGERGAVARLEIPAEGRGEVAEETTEENSGDVPGAPMTGFWTSR